MYTFMHGFSPFYSPFAPALMLALIPFLIVIAVWTITIKGYALWHAARNGQKEWFIALLIINTLGILDVIYLVWFRKQKSSSGHTHHSPITTSSSQ